MTTTDPDYLEAADAAYTTEMERFLRQGMRQVVAAVDEAADIDGRLAAAREDAQSAEPEANVTRQAG